ncbi:conserved hypothetical protein [Lodderomyces elongisporus NRRL YB-4239]|uniref:RNA polymerase-associated protein CTR9 n=1 Tax=Lodderomyces elongisporus (strain ATCC 11503 / CBS 2605 / JCM 1781 / NBRC 1676 / NRRL YB-4239) TaxID=379508 RepID=A5E7D5_LODEL|nr:conserved hypothetical protein [Lodderomyces elongisporus NRRL YB-4239]
MDEALDISYYIGQDGVEALKNVDVPVEGGDVVSLDLTNAEELPQDPQELVLFFTDNKLGKQFWIIVACAYAQLGKLAEAVQLIKLALETSYFTEEDKKTFESVLIWLYFRYASVDAQNGDRLENLVLASSAISSLKTKIYNDSQTSVTNSVSNLLAEAVLAIYQNHDDEAMEIFDRVLKLDHSNCFALLGKAHVTLSKLNNYTLALKLYQQVLLLNPVMKPDPRLGIGLCFWFLKDEKMAKQSWERALEIDPKNIKAKIFLSLTKIYATLNNSLSDEQFLKDYKECLQEVSQLHKGNVTDSTILLVLVSYYFAKQEYDTVERVVKHISQHIIGDSSVSKSATLITKLSKHQQIVLSECSTWLARVQFAREDFTQASKLFQEAIKFNDQNLVAKLGLGQSQFNRGSIEEASLTYESILRTNVDCLEANYSLGILYAKQQLDSRRKKELAIQVLERYIRLSNNRGLSSASKNDAHMLLNKEPITLNAYLTLSKLYEDTDLNQSLTYLTRAADARKKLGKKIPLEIYNNLGVFKFTKQNFAGAAESFQLALDELNAATEFKSADGEDVLIDLPQDLKISLSFNLARSKEVSNENEAYQTYESLIRECPNYFSAKLRILFLSCISESRLSTDEIKTEIDELLDLNVLDLEVRSFYGWFVKNFGKKLGMKPDSDVEFQKDTLVEFDKHDCYALLSLANIYCVMARDLKNSSSTELKKKNYYIRAIELYTKVLTVDPKNVYAAQGLAIACIENKESFKGLDILRKIRDSLNDISVYLNLGHVLCEVKQFGKAIESYELALARYTDGKDVKILSFLGRAWYLRASNEQNLQFFKRALEYSRQALEHTRGSKSALLFNIAYVQFQIADFVSKQPVHHRQPQDISDAIDGLQDAIQTLLQLASEDEKHPPYPKDELRGRANLGSSTLLNRLTSALDETKENIASVEQKLQTAKHIREQEKEAKIKEEQARLEMLKEKEAQLAKERAALQEQAQQWAEEARLNIAVQAEDDKSDGDNDDDDDDEEGDDGGLFNEEKGRGKRGKNSSGRKGKPKKSRKKKVLEDSESEPEADFSGDEDNNYSNDGNDGHDDGVNDRNETRVVKKDLEGKPKKKANRKRKLRVSDDEEDNDENEDGGNEKGAVTGRVNGSKRGKKKQHLSNEFIEDSDEELENDDLFGDEGVDKEDNDKDGENDRDNEKEARGQESE